MTTQRWTLTVVCAATAMLMLDIAVVNTALSRIAEDLHTGLGGLQWVVDAYVLALASTVLTAGSLGDRFGRRRMFAIGLTVFTLASIACGLAGDIGVLHAARAVQGVGGAILFAVSLALLADAYPDPQARAGALAAYIATIGGAFALGPLVGGALVSGLDWQWVFLINVPLGAFCLWVTFRHVRESRDPRAPKVDVPGQVVLTGALGLLVLALLRGNEDGWGSTAIVSELVCAALLLGAFVAIEARAAHPMLPLRFFADRDFAGAQVAAFGISATWFAVYLYITLYAQQVLGLSALEAGLVYLPGTILMFVVAGATAPLVQRVGARPLIVAGLLLVAAGQALVVVVAVDSSWTALLPGSIVGMIGTGLFNSALTNVALGSVPHEQSGLAAGVNDTFRQAGIAVGVAALGALVPSGAALGAQRDPAAYVDGLQTALLVGGAVALTAAIVAGVLLRGPAEAAAARAEMALPQPA